MPLDPYAVENVWDTMRIMHDPDDEAESWIPPLEAQSLLFLADLLTKLTLNPETGVEFIDFLELLILLRTLQLE